MKNCGFDTGAIDGIFSDRTQKAVKDFQAHYSLVADGVIAAKTWAVLIKLDSHLKNCHS
ncbi:peptidoglycan-binding protein [Brasilonema sp. CT11]|nr:peptidoglycan-binding protein [Brasilonema sp. CT11]